MITFMSILFYIAVLTVLFYCLNKFNCFIKRYVQNSNQNSISEETGKCSFDVDCNTKLEKSKTLVFTINHKDYMNYLKDNIIPLMILFLFVITGMYLEELDLLWCLITMIMMIPIVIFVSKLDFYSYWDGQEQILKINSEIILRQKQGIIVHYLWKNIHSIENKKHSIIIEKQQPRYTFFIPKRIFKTKEDENEYWLFLQRCYNQYHNK